MFFKDRSKLLILTILLGLSFLTFAREDAAPLAMTEDVADVEAREYLEAHPLEPFRPQAMKRLRRRRGVEFADRVYAAWLRQRQFPESCNEFLGSCDYYLCREANFPCGTRGYYLSFGYNYCQRSSLYLSARMTPKGQEWLSEVAACLRDRLETDIAPETSCSEVKRLALESHEACYVATNFCNQRFTDIIKTLWMLRPELLRAKILLLGFNIIGRCMAQENP